ncbi:MAG: Rid family detoxifying hydrolase [Clostridiales Family XIII bacterium]|nr:Rid family detoxifying hydrolase [Clostridiales Family XIII bacterium]
METIRTDKAPAAIGPYSQAKKAAGWVFCSGQIPLDPETGNVAGTEITAQTERALENLTHVLSAAGARPEDVLKTTCFLADIADFSAFNEVYAKYFPSGPARSCVAARGLPKGVLVEVEAIAYIGD